MKVSAVSATAATTQLPCTTADFAVTQFFWTLNARSLMNYVLFRPTVLYAYSTSTRADAVIEQLRLSLGEEELTEVTGHPEPGDVNGIDADTEQR